MNIIRILKYTLYIVIALILIAFILHKFDIVRFGISNFEKAENINVIDNSAISTFEYFTDRESVENIKKVTVETPRPINQSTKFSKLDIIFLYWRLRVIILPCLMSPRSPM